MPDHWRQTGRTTRAILELKFKACGQAVYIVSSYAEAKSLYTRYHPAVKFLSYRFAAEQLRGTSPALIAVDHNVYEVVVRTKAYDVWTELRRIIAILNSKMSRT